MMLKIKDQYLSSKIVFAGTGNKTLGERNQEELRKLAIIALKSKDKTLLNLFEGVLPPLAKLQMAETEKAIGETKSEKAAPESKLDKPKGRFFQREQKTSNE